MNEYARHNVDLSGYCQWCGKFFSPEDGAISADQQSAVIEPVAFARTEVKYMAFEAMLHHGESVINCLDVADPFVDRQIVELERLLSL